NARGLVCFCRCVKSVPSGANFIFLFNGGVACRKRVMVRRKILWLLREIISRDKREREEDHEDDEDQTPFHEAADSVTLRRRFDPRRGAGPPCFSFAVC